MVHKMLLAKVLCLLAGVAIYVDARLRGAKIADADLIDIADDTEMKAMLTKPWEHFLQGINMAGGNVDMNLLDSADGAFDATKTELFKAFADQAAYDDRLIGLQGNLCMPMNVQGVAGNLHQSWSTGCASEIVRMTYKASDAASTTAKLKFKGLLLKPSLNSNTKRKEWVRKGNPAKHIISSEERATNFSYMTVDTDYANTSKNFLDSTGKAYGPSTEMAIETAQDRQALKLMTVDLERAPTKFDSFGYGVFTEEDLGKSSDFNLSLEFVHSTFSTKDGAPGASSNAVTGNWMGQMRKANEFFNNKISDEMEWTATEQRAFSLKPDETKATLKAAPDTQDNSYAIGNMYFHIVYVDPDTEVKYTLQTNGRPDESDGSLYFVPEDNKCKTGGSPVLFRTSHLVWYPETLATITAADFDTYGKAMFTLNNGLTTPTTAMKQLQSLEYATDLTRNAWLNQPVSVMATVGMDWINKKVLLRMVQELQPALEYTDLQDIVQALYERTNDDTTPLPKTGDTVPEMSRDTKEKLQSLAELIAQRAGMGSMNDQYAFINKDNLLDIMESTSQRKISFANNTNNGNGKEYMTSTFSYGMHLVQTYDVSKCGNLVLEFRIWLPGDFRFYATQEAQKNGWALECHMPDGQNLLGVTSNYSDWNWKTGVFRRSDCPELQLTNFTSTEKCGLGVSKVGPAYLSTDKEDAEVDNQSFLGLMNPYLNSFSCSSVKDNCGNEIGLALRMGPSLCVNSNPFPATTFYTPNNGKVPAPTAEEIKMKPEAYSGTADQWHEEIMTKGQNLEIKLNSELMFGSLCAVDYCEDPNNLEKDGTLINQQIEILEQSEDLFKICKWTGDKIVFNRANAACVPCCDNEKNNVVMVLYNFSRDDVENGNLNCCVSKTLRAEQSEPSLQYKSIAPKQQSDN